MFPRSQERLKAQLEERLRMALDFATLGAYEAEGAAQAARREVPQRVFLFAKVSPPCPHGHGGADPCDAAGAEPGGRSAAPRSPARRGRRERARRGGMAQLPPQPCTWSHDQGA